MKTNKILSLFAVIILMAHNSCNNLQDKTSHQTSSTMKITKEVFGNVNNTEVYLYTLTNLHGMTLQITNYGGIITSLSVPDADGDFDDVVLGYDNLDDYLNESPYFGAIVGRYANRIAKGQFTLEGKEYNLAVNNGENHLHGGLKGFDKVIWEAEEINGKDTIGLRLHYLSKHGEEGYPGNLDVTVKYLLNNQNELVIEYSATTDQSTYVNLSHHGYFNLAGSSGRDILGQSLWIDADYYTYVNSELIPTGELKAVRNTPMDFSKTMPIGSRIALVPGGYDHNYVLNPEKGLNKVASLTDSISGRKMEVLTTEPGLQFYAGNFLDGSIMGKSGIKYRKHFGLCLEAQHFPDSPNHPQFPSTLLDPGEEYRQTTIYRFGVIK